MGVYIQGIKPYFKDQNSALFLADTFEALANMKSECIDMIRNLDREDDVPISKFEIFLTLLIIIILILLDLWF